MSSLLQWAQVPAHEKPEKLRRLAPNVPLSSYIRPGFELPPYPSGSLPETAPLLPKYPSQVNRCDPGCCNNSGARSVSMLLALAKPYGLLAASVTLAWLS